MDGSIDIGRDCMVLGIRSNGILIKSKTAKEHKNRERMKVGMAKDEEHWKNPRISRYEAVLRVS